eukprot:1884-Heterococcus_DN1.PRE.1
MEAASAAAVRRPGTAGDLVLPFTCLAALSSVIVACSTASSTSRALAHRSIAPAEPSVCAGTAVAAAIEIDPTVVAPLSPA